MMAVSFPWQRLLIPYDGSPSAQQALEWAAALARAGGATVERVTLLRVISGGYLARHMQNVDLRVTRMDQIEAWQRVQKHHLEHDLMPPLEEAKQILEARGVGAPVDTRVAEGKIGDEILRVCEQEGINAIIMGRRGLSPIQGLLLGSVTRQVLSAAPKMTVFVVGQEAAFHPDCPLSAILLPVDGSEPSLEAVRQGAAVAQACRDGHPRLTLLNIIDFDQLHASLGTGTEELAQAGESILAQSRQVLRDAGFQELVEDKLLVGQPPRVIAQEAEAGNHDLILMGARGLSPLKQLFLGSVSSEVLSLAARSVVGVVYI